MKKEMTSKERILETLARRPTDHLPLCFEGICHGHTQFVSRICSNNFERALFF
jgi:hypothetical protein